MSEVNAVTATGGTTTTTPAATTTKAAATTAKDFKETLEKVSGHHYAKVADGERKGMFVNQSGNARDGEAFKLVERDGHEFHIYGTGADRKVFEVKVADAAKPQDSSRS